MQVLIERGANLNLKNDDSFTALFLAAFYKHLPVLAALISAGNVNHEEIAFSLQHVSGFNF